MAITDGLISHWRLNEASGTRYDAWGVQHLDDNNTVLAATGKLGDAADFEASDSEYLNRPDTASLSTGNVDFTLCLWFKAESFAALANTLVTKGAYGNGDLEYFIDVATNGTALRFIVSADGTTVINVVTSAVTPLSTGTWYFVVVWHDATLNTINIQVNDGAVDSVAHTTGLTDLGGDFRIGGHLGLTYYWDGLIDSVSFKKGTLFTAGEKTALYNAGAGLDFLRPMAGQADGYITSSAWILKLVNLMLDYDGDDDGLFTHLGVLIYHYNQQRATGEEADLNADEIFNAFQLGDRDLLVEGLAGQAENWKSEYTGRMSYLAEIALRRLQQRESVLEEIGAVTTDIEEILVKLTHQMIADGETVNRCTVSVGVVNEGNDNSINTGTGTVLVCTLLDGVNSPGAGPVGGYLSTADYRSLNSELALTAETMLLICSADSDTDGVTEGSEPFTWSGGPQHSLHGMETNQGSGDIGSVNCAHASQLLFNLDFEDAAVTNTPDSWDIDNGSVGTHIFVTTTANEFYHGDSGLKFAGTGAAATIKISQTVTGIGAAVDAGRLYCVALRVKATATIAAGDFTCQFEGTGYSAVTGTAEVQTVQVSGTPSGGDYLLHWNGQTTGAIAYNATSATVQTALRLLTGLESVVVATAAGAAPDITHSITMHGCWGPQNEMTSTSNLTGGTPVIGHATTTQGVAGERIYLPAASLPTTWSLRHFWIVMPDSLPDDFELVLKWTGTPTNVKYLYIDDLAFSEGVYGGGVAIVIVRGAVPFVRDDRFTFSVANDDAGVFQTWFRNVFGFQLPSSASPTIADALAS